MLVLQIVDTTAFWSNWSNSNDIHRTLKLLRTDKEIPEKEVFIDMIHKPMTAQVFEDYVLS